MLSFASDAPTDEEVLERLRSIMESEFGLPPERIQPSIHLIDDLDLDSIDLVDLAVTLEETSGIRLDEEELKTVMTVQDAVDVVRAAMARRSTDAA